MLFSNNKRIMRVGGSLTSPSKHRKKKSVIYLYAYFLYLGIYEGESSFRPFLLNVDLTAVLLVVLLGVVVVAVVALAQQNLSPLLPHSLDCSDVRLILKWKGTITKIKLTFLSRRHKKT